MTRHLPASSPWAPPGRAMWVGPRPGRGGGGRSGMRRLGHVHGAATTVHDAAIRFYRNALMRAVATAPARRPKLWARAESARRLAEALGVTPQEITAMTLTVARGL